MTNQTTDALQYFARNACPFIACICNYSCVALVTTTTVMGMVTKRTRTHTNHYFNIVISTTLCEIEWPMAFLSQKPSSPTRTQLRKLRVWYGLAHESMRQ
mmetsp:Transcript_18903/g.52555  ORF Transcript_18903/g.52555 Transcript_18903/m.52555 type:complete len:100 (-) Transcript_18903:295-594(-)